MATKIIAAHKRMFKNMFVCRDCGQKMRTDPIRIVGKQIACRRCSGRVFRPARSKKK